MHQNWIKYNTETASKSTQDCSPLLCYRFVSTALTAQIPNGNAIANLLGLLHTGKERDSETGLSYFGARYYDSDLMTGWLSVDPMADDFLYISPYNYCNWNPVKLKDPDGEAPVKAFVTAAKLVKKAYNIYKKTGKLTASSLKKVGLDELIGIADDINTIFSGDASLMDRMAAAVDLLAGTELNNKGVKKSLSIAGVKKGPPSNGGKSKPHGGYHHNEEIDNVIKSIPQNAKSIRKIKFKLMLTGINRPDIQYDYEGKHYVIEIDNRKRTSTMHEKTIRQNDPKCEIKLIIYDYRFTKSKKWRTQFNCSK